MNQAILNLGFGPAEISLFQRAQADPASRHDGSTGIDARAIWEAKR